MERYAQVFFFDRNRSLARPLMDWFRNYIHGLLTFRNMLKALQSGDYAPAALAML